VGHVKYNHAAIALDKDLNRLYAFARSKHCNLLSGKLVRENLERYTLRYKYNVDCMIFKVPVTNHEYEIIEKLIHDIHKDKTYLYNLFSVILFPLFHGFTTYNAFSCIEFVMFILKYFTDIETPDKLPCNFKPDELIDILKDYVYYTGDLKDYMANSQNDSANAYFEPLTAEDVKTGATTLCILLYRLLFTKLKAYK
jgi:hypothetical protein